MPFAAPTERDNIVCKSMAMMILKRATAFSFGKWEIGLNGVLRRLQ